MNNFLNELFCVKDELFYRHSKYAEIHEKGFVLNWLTGSDPHGCAAGKSLYIFVIFHCFRSGISGKRKPHLPVHH